MARVRTLKKACTLQELSRVCRPEPLEGAELEAFFVETDKARDPHQHTRERIARGLEKEDTRMLLYGHRGCGKTTELNKFVSEQGGRFLPVKFSVLEDMTPSNVRAEDLILVITERILNAARDNNLDIDEKQLQPVLDYFAVVTETSKEADLFSLKAGAGVDARSGVLGKLLGIFTTLRADIQHDSYSDTTKLSHLRKRPSDLIIQANLVIEAVRSKLPPPKRLLVIVEDIDKLDLKQARDMYVNYVTLLTGIDTNIIYTIPIFLFHSPDVGAFKPRFDDVVCMPMIKVTEPPDRRVEGFHTVREIVLRRVEKGFITDAALDQLVAMTGGVLRHAFEVLFIVGHMNGVKPPIDVDHIRYGLDQLKKEFWSQVTLPAESIPGGPSSVNELYDRLAEHARNQMKGKKSNPIADATNQVLLRSCALIEYNGEGWFGVHPLVIENLKAMGRIP